MLWVPVLIVSWLISAAPGLLSAAVTGSAVLAYFFAGHVLQLRALRRADWVGLVLVLGSYLGRIMVLGVLLWQLVSSPIVSGRVQQAWFVAAACAVVVGWISGVVWTRAHQRVSIYDVEATVPTPWEDHR